MSNELIISIIFLAVSVCFIIYQISKGRCSEIMPSIMWFGFMTLPFVLQWSYFAAGSRELQAMGIIIIGLALMMGDLAPVSNVQPAVNKVNKNRLIIRLINDYRVYVLAFLLIVIYHLTQIGEIPLLAKYFYHADPIKIKVLRENSSKLLDVPVVSKYMFTWATGIIAPVGFLLMLKRKLYLRASLFILLALLYARITMALLPSLYMLFIVCFLAILEWKLRLSRRYTALLIIILSPFLIKTGLFLVTSPYSVFHYQANAVSTPAFAKDDPRSISTIPDNYRSIPKDKVPFIKQQINYVVYRFFLVPAEVSGKWYQYYPEVNGGYIGFADLLPGGRGPGFVHPANAVGRWAYEQKHPQKYLDSVHAYASIDADAHARVGMTGVLLTALVLLSIRLFIKKILVNSFISRCLYGIVIVQLSLLPVQASLPAILVAHGMVILLLLMAVHNIFTAEQPQLFKLAKLEGLFGGKI